MRIILALSALLAIAAAADLNHVGHHNQQHQQHQQHQHHQQEHQQQHNNGGQNAVPSLFYQQPEIQIRNEPTVQTQQHQTFFQQQPVQILQQQQQQQQQQHQQQQQQQQPIQVLQQQQEQQFQQQQQQHQQQQQIPIQLLQQHVQQMHQQQLPVNLEINAQQQSQQQQFEHVQLQQQQFEHDQLQQQQNQQQQFQQEEQQQNQVLMQEIVSTLQQNNGQDINNGMNSMFLIKQQPQFTSENAGAFFINNNNDNGNQVNIPQLHQANNMMNIESENNLIQSQGQNDQSFQTQIFQFDSNDQQQQQSPQHGFNFQQISNGAQIQQSDLRITNEQQESSQEGSFQFSQGNLLNKNNFQTAQILPAIIAPVQSQEGIFQISQENSFETNGFQTPQILPAPIRPVLPDGIPQDFTRPTTEPVFIQSLIQTKPAQEPESETSSGLFLQDGIPQEFTRPAPEPVFSQTLIQTKPAQVPETKISAVLSLQDEIPQEFTRPAPEPPIFTQTLIQTKPAQEPELEIITEQPEVLDRPAVEQIFTQNLIQTKPAQQPEFAISTVDFPENTVEYINESEERKTSLVQTLPAQIPQFDRKSAVNFVNARSKPATNVQQNLIHTFSRPTTRIDSTHCGEGKLADIHGNCVTPEVTRNIFLYAAPHRPRSMRRRIVAPKPKLEYNIVFVRNPITKGDVDPIVIPPPQQKTLVYVLNKKSQMEKQGLLQVPTHPTLKPEVYFVDYGEGENPNLPGGVDLESALSQMAMEGKVINQLIDSSASHEVDFIEVNTEQNDDFSQTVDIRNLTFEDETTDVPTGYDYPSQN